MNDLTPVEIESWLPVLGYEGLYEVSNFGRVKSLDRTKTNRWGEYVMPGRVLRSAVVPGEYPIVALTKDGKIKSRRVHLLVLESFVGPRPTGMFACHNDGDATNSHLSNLRWDTASANTYDKIRHGTHTQAAQTHCRRGHPLGGPDANVQVRPNGRRRCRICENVNAKRRRDERLNSGSD